MMKKILFSLGIIGISFLTGYATAQSYFVNNTPSTNAAGTGNPQGQNILSPSDFESQTQQLENKKKQTISDQFKQDLAKIPPTPPPPPAPTTPEAAMPEETAMPEAGQTNAPKSKPPTAANPPATQVPIQEAAPSGPVPAAPPAAAPPQSKVYTGFQNPNQGENQSAPSGSNQNQPSSSSGGWNIKY